MIERYKIIKDKGYDHTPIMTLNPNKNDFYEFIVDDFALEHYEPIRPQLKLELGI